MAESDSNRETLRRLGAGLRTVRKAAALTQAQVCAAMGMKTVSSRAHICRIEKGELRNVTFLSIMRYLHACKAPVGQFMLGLAQSGVFGEAEAGPVVMDDSSSSRLTVGQASAKLSQMKRAKAKRLYDKRWEREAQDSAIVAKLWREVAVAIQPLLAQELPSRRFLAPYLEGVRALYRAWKQAVRGAGSKDPVPDIEIAFDRIEQLGCQRLVPGAVRKMREIVFTRLMERMPQGGNT
jgi:transcriptional regulator with XRE-family HTH domain